ncbi:DUF3221 domain-containing protein [Amphibacillus sediminis]|uniref:DUF3221 domain-containing protein n=1 Tax=Amphibacillus sediminis TaxID=360185 RepID=UPI00082A0D3F|nr:DUF3221 domain-containing protein [Amphibacillus sediminis]
MRKCLFFIVLMFISISLSGCFSSEQPNVLTGYVVAQAPDRILVASIEAQDLSDNGGVSEFYDMIWFYDPPADLKQGDKIDAWYNHKGDTYPGKSVLVDHQIHELTPPEGALLTEAEALNYALLKQDNHPSKNYAVRSILFNQNQGKWEIKLFEIWSTEVVEIELIEQEYIS